MRPISGRPHGVLLLTALLLGSCQGAGPASSDEAELLRLHQEVLRAHREGNPEPWTAAEADSFVSVNRGRVSVSTLDQRLPGRRAYLESATFDAYRDVRDPVVRVAADGTLGWVIAEVEVLGRLDTEDGPRRISEVWAWVELYENRGDGWKMVGNVSNSRPAPGEADTDTGPLPCVDRAGTTGVVDDYFRILSGPRGEGRDWNEFRRLFLETARMEAIGIDHRGENRFFPQTLSQYVDHLAEYVAVHGFFQRDLDREIRCRGRVANVFNRFESRNERDGPVIDRGAMTFQLLHDGTRWRIAQVMWQSEPRPPEDRD